MKKLKYLLKKFDINCKILKWNGRKPKSNIQAIARTNRKLSKIETKEVPHILKVFNF